MYAFIINRDLLSIVSFRRDKVSFLHQQTITPTHQQTHTHTHTHTRNNTSKLLHRPTCVFIVEEGPVPRVPVACFVYGMLCTHLSNSRNDTNDQKTKFCVTIYHSSEQKHNLLLFWILGSDITSYHPLRLGQAAQDLAFWRDRQTDRGLGAVMKFVS